MSFCTQCETYLAPDATSCAACGAPQPQVELIAVSWFTELGEPPAGPLLAVGDLLLVPMQEPSRPVQHFTLHALNLVDGSPRWQRSFEYALVGGLAAVQTSEVSQTSEVLALVATSSTDLMRGEGALLVLDVKGEERWCWSPGVQHVSPPAVAGDVVCVTADAKMLVALDLTIGVEQARIELEASASRSAPTLVDGVAYVPCRGPHLLAMGLDGKMHWRFDAQDTPDAWLNQTPVVIGKGLFAVLNRVGAVLALRVEDGSLTWQAAVGPSGKDLSPPATDGERLCIGACDGLHALDLDGREMWTFPTTRRITAAPVVEGGVVYAACHDHHLYALDATSGRELWQYEVGRRIEVSPVVATCGEPAGPCVLVADRGGTLTAVARPLSAAEHEAAGRWVEAASAYAARGQFARGAELLEAHGEPFKAAELWKAAGERERAAVQYETAGAWQQAAELWSALGRPLKQAEALEQHAWSLEGRLYSDEERAVAWTAAAKAFEAEGEIERAAACRWEMARCLRQPIITLDVQLSEGLVLNAWSRLQFIVRNEGYGPARNLIIRASGDQFEGQVTATRRIATLRAGRERTDKLDVHPLQHGDSVPLRVSVEYEDQTGEACICESTIYMPVARIEADRGMGWTLHIETSGGAVVIGDVVVEGGDFAGRDVVASAGPDRIASPGEPTAIPQQPLDAEQPTPTIPASPAIPQLANLIRARRQAGDQPYTLLLGSSLSLTPEVRQAVCGSHDWETFWIAIQGLSATERRALLAGPLDNLNLASGYRCLAGLTQAGYVNFILTANIDDTLDNALRILPAGECQVLCHGRTPAPEIVAALSRPAPRVKAIKLRGDIHAYKLPLTPEGQFEFPKELEEAVERLLSQDTILVGDIPYDTDIQRCIRQGEGALWVVVPEPPAAGSFLYNAKKARPTGGIISGPEAEFVSFFSALARELGMESSQVGDRPPPVVPLPQVVAASNPFGDTGRITDTDRFFDREELLRRIFEELGKGVNLSLVGESQVGKSSLLSIVCALGPEKMGLPLEAFAYLSLEWVDDEDDFYEALCDALHIEPCRGFKLTRALRDKQYVLCLDEIEKMAWEGFTVRLRSQLRGLADGPAAPLKLVIASRSPLAHLFPDSPELDSPLAGICRQLDVGPFPPDVARAFLADRLRNTGVTFSEEQIAAAIHESGGHPARLQQILRGLYERRAGV